MKETGTKGVKPSEMGLHPTVRCEVKLPEVSRPEQEEIIVTVVMELYEVIRRIAYSEKEPGMFTWRFARFISKAFLFKGFTDEEIYNVLERTIDRNRKRM